MIYHFYSVCAHVPCRNGGHCSHDSTQFFCNCPRDYTGRTCECEDTYDIITFHTGLRKD